MSGIVGMVNLDGAPVDRNLLQRMTGYMDFRGPDRQAIWNRDNVGFGHAALCTTEESLSESQPQSLDNRLWITADARIDGRDELRAKLAANGRRGIVTDADLILHAYDVWGDACVEHLLGDFAFAIWDGPRQRLFCARDHFGVKLFYYAHAGACFVFSNTLNCVRRHRAVGDRLNDHAIGDFLLFGYNPVLSTTTFSDIQRLPPAHSLTLSAGGLQVRRYWSLPRDGDLIRYKNTGDYIDRFKELLRQAVKDRLRTNRIGILLSGGMDSTALAATARELQTLEGVPAQIHAYCCVYDRSPDDERFYAGLAARTLGIPIEYLVLDDYPLFKDWDHAELVRPEPCDSPLLAIDRDLLKLSAPQSRVIFFGEDGDALLSSTSVVDMLKTSPLSQVVADVLGYCLNYRRRPRIGLGVLSIFKRLAGARTDPVYPPWFDASFAVKYDLPRRWREEMNNKNNHRLTHSLWQTVFEACDPGVTRFAVEHRLPLMDLRVVNFARAVPPLPWRENKELLRAAMRGILPEEVCRRRKTPLQFDPYEVRLKKLEARWIDNFEPTAGLSKYIDRKAIPKITGVVRDARSAEDHLRPLMLNFWLQSL